MKFEITPIAHIENDFTEKFGIPRQSGLADVRSRIIFEPEFRNADALRGIEGYSHLWLIWQFSEAQGRVWTPTVRPPRLGGNVRMGVFASRSPFRPNSLGLSSVRLEGVEYDDAKGAVLIVSGADIMNGTPVFDIKPYLAYTDSHPDAKSGFALAQTEGTLSVDMPSELMELIPEDKRRPIMEILAQDPRPQYQNDSSRVYTMSYGGMEISFQTDNKNLSVIRIERNDNNANR